MKKIILSLLLLGSTLSIAKTYSQEDWKVYDACKVRVYDNKANGYDYDACKEMLSHKRALRKYGAESSYNYWIKRLKK